MRSYKSDPKNKVQPNKKDTKKDTKISPADDLIGDIVDVQELERFPRGCAGTCAPAYRPRTRSQLASRVSAKNVASS